MPVSAPTTTGDDFITLTPEGSFYIDGQAGTDTLTIDYSSLLYDIRYVGGWNGREFTEDFFNTVGYVNFEHIVFKGGSGNDDLRATDGADQLFGNAGNDSLYSYLGADVVNGGDGVDRWVADYGSLTASVLVTLPAVGATYTVSATGAKLTSIEALTLYTGSGADVITTTSGIRDDDIRTRGGDDSISVGRGRDYVDAGDGTDTLTMSWSGVTAAIKFQSVYGGGIYSAGTTDRLEYYWAEKVNLTGGTGNDDLRGGGLSDKLLGGAGNDTLRGAGGLDTIDGGTGVDRWEADYSALTGSRIVNIDVAEGVAATVPTGASVKNVEALTIVMGAGNDRVTAKAGVYNDDIRTNNGNDVISVQRGKDYVDGGGGEDTIVMNWSGVTAPIVFQNVYGGGIYTAGSTDRLEVYWVEKVDYTGGAGNDDLRGGGLGDKIVGGAGNDRIDGSAGADTLDGGVGTDTWVGDQSGNLRAVLFSATSSQTVAQGVGAGLSIRNIESLNLTTGAGNDSLSTAGFAFNDSISTRDGNDTVNPGLGTDTVDFGGGGADTLVMNWGAVTAPVAFQSVYGGGIYTAGGNNSLTYYWAEKVSFTGGSGDDDLRGGGLGDKIVGGAGNDRLDANAGADTLDGGAGSDIWVGDQSGNLEAVLFDATASQTVAQGGLAGLSIRNIEALSLTTGADNDSLSTAGFALNDSISTRDGDDTVNPGRGFDSVDFGGGGGDKLIVDYSSATTSVTQTDVYGGGYIQDADATMQAYYYWVERMDLTGGSGDDVLRGGNSDDRLVGNAGDDVLNGAGGIDTIDGGTEVDTWIGNFSGSLDDLTLTMSSLGSGTVVGNGTQLTGIENVQVTTGRGDDAVSTANLSGDDSLSTGDGDDAVNLGRGYNERADGGSGNDTLTVNMSLANSGVSSWTFYGGRGYSNNTGNYHLEYSWFESVDLTGTGYNDKLYGTDGADKLSGGNGSDLLVGYNGDDLLRGGAGSDQFLINEWWNAGHDTVADGATGDFIRVSGVAMAGTVTAGNGAAVTAGQVQVQADGGDTLLHVGCNAAAGADLVVRLNGTYAASAFSLSGSDIRFTAGSTSTPTPGDDVFTGTSGNDNLSGGGGNDKLSGLGGNDILNGGIGNDTLTGGAGHDNLTGGTGADRFVFVTATDSGIGPLEQDVIADFSSAEGDKIDVKAIDANPVTAGVQAWAFIAGEFTGAAGQLRFDSTEHLLMFDRNGDGTADFQIGMPSVSAFTGASLVVV